MNKQPYLVFLFFLVIGILVDYYSHFQLNICLILLIFSFGLLTLALFKFPKQFHYFLLGFIFIFGITITLLYQSKPKNDIGYYISKNPKIVEFQVVKNLNTTKFYKKYEIEVLKIQEQNKWRPVSGKLLLLIPKDQSINFNADYLYAAYGNINVIPISPNPYQFNYKQYLSNQNIDYQLKTTKIIKTEIRDASFLTMLYNYRTWLLNHIDKSSYSGFSKEIIKAMTVGDRTDMSEESRKAFANSGLVHLLSISGLHMGIIFIALYWVLSLIIPWRLDKLRIILTLIFIWLFGLLIGFSAAVNRSLIMITLYLIFRLINKPFNTYYVLFLSAFILLIINPLQIFDIGFQLSYSAVFFLLWLTEPIENLFKVQSKYLKHLASYFAVSIAAFLGTLPIVLLHFHQVHLLGILANIIIVPISIIFVLAAFVGLFQIIFLPTWIWVIKLIDFIYMVLQKLTYSVAGFSSLFIENVPFIFSEAFVLIISFIYLKYLLLRLSWQRLIPFLSLIFLFYSIRLIYYETTKQNELVVFSDYENSVVSYASNHHLALMSNKPISDNFINYALKPYTTHQWIKQSDILIKDLNQNLNFALSENHIYLISKAFDKDLKVHKNILILINSPLINWTHIDQHSIKTIVLDNSNTKAYIKEIQKLFPADKLWIIRERGAFIIK